MKYVFVAIVAALCCVQVLEARVARSADQANPFDRLVTDFNSTFQQLVSAFQGTLPSRDEVKQTLQTQASNLATVLQNTITEFSEKAQQQSTELQAAMSRASQNLQQHVHQLREQFPDAAQGADKVKSSMQSILAEANTLQETLRQNMEPAATSIKNANSALVQQATQLSNTLQHEIQQLANTQ